MARLGPQRRRKYMYMNDKYMFVCVCVCRFEGAALLCIALVAVVRCSMQCRSNGCKLEGTFCLRVSLVEGHYSFQKIIIYLNSI